jgi:hypothetical protein
MFVNWSDCSTVIKTAHWEKDVPYSDETIREAVSILKEEAPIEWDGICRGLRKVSGVAGCVVTPLTIGTVPLLLYLAMGAAGNPAYISETKNLYQYRLDLLPMEDTEHFDLIQDRGMKKEERKKRDGSKKIKEEGEKEKKKIKKADGEVRKRGVLSTRHDYRQGYSFFLYSFFFYYEIL